MPHPFETLAPATRKRALFASMALAAIATGVMGWIDGHYHTAAAPAGIVNFELARTPMMAQMILDSWSRETGMNAWVAFGIGIDYLYLVLYSTFFAFVSAAIAVRLEPSSPSLARIARLVAWLQLVAAICDAIENAGLMAMLARVGTDPWALVSTIFASVKFACLGTFVSLVIFVGPFALRAKPAADVAPTA